MAESAKNLSFFNFQFFFKTKSLRFLILKIKENIYFVFGTKIIFYNINKFFNYKFFNKIYCFNFTSFVL